MENTDSLQLVSINKACNTLGISRPTFYKLVRNRIFSPVKIGRKSLISLSEIQSYIEKLKGEVGHE